MCLMSLLVGLHFWLKVCITVVASLFHYIRILGISWRYFQIVIFWALVDEGSVCSIAWGRGLMFLVAKFVAAGLAVLG